MTNKSEVNQLVKELEEEDKESEDLDDLVYQCKSEEATAINNGGLSSQVEYLLSTGLTNSSITAWTHE